MRHDLARVGHLRQPTWRHEGGHFDLAQTRGMQRADPPPLGLGGHGGGDRLQPVARAHLADQHAVRVGMIHLRAPLINVLSYETMF
jgi:hypothetical protein